MRSSSEAIIELLMLWTCLGSRSLGILSFGQQFKFKSKGLKLSTINLSDALLCGRAGHRQTLPVRVQGLGVGTNRGLQGSELMSSTNLFERPRP